MTTTVTASRSLRSVGTLRGPGTIARALLTLVVLFTTVLTAGGMVVQPRAASAQEDGTTFPGFGSDWSAPSTVYIPETGHSIDGWFLDMWRENGAASVFGDPITPELTRDDGSIVQYYEFARFEYWPNGDAEGNQITLGDIGADLRPAAITRLPLGGSSAKAAEMTRVAMAWEPLADSAIKPDSDTYMYVEETGHSIYDGFMGFWLNSGLQWYLGNPISEEYVVGSVHYQVFERGQLRWEPGGDIQMVPVGQQIVDQQRLDQDATAQGDIPTYDEALFVPPAPPTMDEIVAASGADPNGERWIDVSLTDEYLIAYQGDTIVLQTYISSGKPGFETPTGTFYINSKIPEQDMEGVIGGEYYDVPKVPDVMYFTGVGHAIHGTYWHNNFGNPMSHGCINVPLDLAHFLYEWASVGTRVEIHF